MLKISLIRFGFNDSNKSQNDLEIDCSFGARHLQNLIPERRKELVHLLREYADAIESGWLSNDWHTVKGAGLRICDCPEGSLCGFFNKDNECCMYGDI